MSAFQENCLEIFKFDANFFSQIKQTYLKQAEIYLPLSEKEDAFDLIEDSLE